MILTAFDSEKKAIINPEDLNPKIEDFPKVVVSCFARETFRRLVTDFSGQELTRTAIANQEIPIYVADVNSQKIGLFNSVVGAPACVAILEDLAAMGMETLVLFGTCGVLEESIKETSIIVPTMAIRDEGTSFHYAPLSDEILVNQHTQEQFLAFLKEKGISYTTGKVWTTDGIYRETIGKLNHCKDLGAICVDMEASAVAAWADFRQINVCHFFYAADHLSEEAWNPRSLSNTADLDEKDKIAALAMALALSFAEEI
ncbi:nucleoside phosphorylase [Streptococcus moroccensis]|uniref:Uridine phosphorylase n=1 Tax=Streptococcus moroccensis TaxID=1451356 RepID=A0ABT9YNJ0_9STRE|nr:nucleoside phosphorylase [Streptococcus moroccensis]MDQ0221549.1 uridine phosphorylase [Streptococcus moroccensis]